MRPRSLSCHSRGRWAPEVWRAQRPAGSNVSHFLVELNERPGGRAWSRPRRGDVAVLVSVSPGQDNDRGNSVTGVRFDGRPRNQRRQRDRPHTPGRRASRNGPPTGIATLLHRRHRNERAATVNQWPPVRRLQVETAIYGMEIRCCRSVSVNKHLTSYAPALTPETVTSYRAIPMRNLLNGRRWYLST